MAANDGNWWHSRWSHLRLADDTPDLELAPGVHARIAAVTGQIMVVQVRMEPGAKQHSAAHEGESVLSVLSGSAAITVGDDATTLRPDEVAVIFAGGQYFLVAGAEGCLRIDVFSPPHAELAEAAFHEEHANHGFE